jgi:endonuclease YncB( thermonuclease family)
MLMTSCKLKRRRCLLLLLLLLYAAALAHCFNSRRHESVTSRNGRRHGNQLGFNEVKQTTSSSSLASRGKEVTSNDVGVNAFSRINNDDVDVIDTDECCINNRDRNNNIVKNDHQHHLPGTTSRRRFWQQLARRLAVVASVTATATTSTKSNTCAAETSVLESPSETTTTTTTSNPSSATVSNPTIRQQPPSNLYQFETAGMVPRIYFEERRSIYGFVERVMDGDTIRVTHVPMYPYDGIVPQPIQKRGISDCTIAIRLYGIDAPEVAKSKKQVSMPFGDDSKLFVSNMILHKMVKITLLQKDKYGRAIGAVETIPSNPMEPSKDLSIELAQRGLAELYTGGGAQYWVRYEFDRRSLC